MTIISDRNDLVRIASIASIASETSQRKFGGCSTVLDQMRYTDLSTFHDWAIQLRLFETEVET